MSDEKHVMEEYEYEYRNEPNPQDAYRQDMYRQVGNRPSGPGRTSGMRPNSYNLPMGNYPPQPDGYYNQPYNNYGMMGRSPRSGSMNPMGYMGNINPMGYTGNVTPMGYMGNQYNRGQYYSYPEHHYGYHREYHHHDHPHHGYYEHDDYCHPGYDGMMAGYPMGGNFMGGNPMGRRWRGWMYPHMFSNWLQSPRVNNFFRGVGVATVAVLLAPTLTKALRPLAVQAVQGVKTVVDEITGVVSEAKEDIEDIFAEAKWDGMSQNTDGNEGNGH